MKGRKRVIRELREKAKEHVIRRPKGLQKGKERILPRQIS